MCTVSVIIPIYNAEKFLRRCLDSLVGQTFSDWEAVCVNDGSLDGSSSILAEYAAVDSRFKVVDKPNGGVADARNAGLDVACGEYLAFLDPDDFFHPQTLELAVGLSRRDGTDIVCWTYDRTYRRTVLAMRTSGTEEADYRPKGFYDHIDIGGVRRNVSYDMVSHLTEMENPKGLEWPIRHFYLWQFLIRTELTDGLRFIPDLRIYEDFPWMCELQLRNPSVTITELPLYYYYPNESSIDMSLEAGSVRARCLMVGLEHCMRLYSDADAFRVKVWSRLCKWPEIRFQLRGNLEHSAQADRKELCAMLRKLRSMGTFSDPPSLGYRICRLKICRFMKTTER